MEGFGTTLFAIGDPGRQSGVAYQLEKTTDVTKVVIEYARHEELF